MKTIWKYEIKPGVNKMKMPLDSQVLDVQTQEGIPQMWALVNPSAAVYDKIFYVYGTGHDVANDRGLTYIGTFQLKENDFPLVFHLFEKL